MSTPHPRDRALEHLLRGRTPPSPDATSACADAETLAAWVDGGLDAQAMVETESHLSNCARCQAMLAAIVRSEPDAPAVAPWWSRMHLRWLVPLTAAAAATILWVVVPGPRTDLPVAAPETMQARAEQGAPARSAEPQEKGVSAAPATGSPPTAPASPAPPAPAGNEARGAPPADRPRAETSALDQAQPNAVVGRAREEAMGERQALAKQQPAETLARVNEREAESLKETVTVPGVTPAAEAPRAARAVPPPAPPAAVAAGAVAGFESDAAAIPSRDGIARWRLAIPGPADSAARRSVDGMVNRSDDGGATWQPVSTGIPRRFTAGFAPSATVCWLIGPGGTVALTTDARTWRQLSAPAPDADLTSIEASDARTATVRDTQGRTFRTTDGGATWIAVP